MKTAEHMITDMQFLRKEEAYKINELFYKTGVGVVTITADNTAYKCCCATWVQWDNIKTQKEKKKSIFFILIW